MPISRTIFVRFIVVKLQSSYNAILGKPTLNIFKSSSFNDPFGNEVPQG